MNRRQFIADSVAITAAACVNLGVGSADALLAQSPTGSKRIVKLAAKPEPIDLDLAITGVVVIDMQNDFCSKGGLLDRQGFDLSIPRRTIAPTRIVLSAARRAGLKIVYTKMAYQPDLSDVGPPGSPNWVDMHLAGTGDTITAPNGTPSRILICDTWNTDIIAELRPEPNDTVVYKNRYSAFYRTELDTILKQWGTRFLVVTGCTTSICVESTLRDAAFRDYSPILLADCTAEPEGYDLPRSNYEASLFLIERYFGRVSSSEQFVHAVGRPAQS